MADNNKVTIDAAWFAELYAKANEKYNSNDEKSKKIAELKDELQGSRNCYYECRDELLEVTKDRDELKAKLSTAQNYEAVIAAKDREIEGVKEERNRLNAKVNELKAKLDGECKTCVSQDEAKVLAESLAAAERCIEEAFEAWTNEDGTDASYNRIGDIIRAYREKEAT